MVAAQELLSATGTAVAPPGLVVHHLDRKTQQAIAAAITDALDIVQLQTFQPHTTLVHQQPAQHLRGVADIVAINIVLEVAHHGAVTVHGTGIRVTAGVIIDSIPPVQILTLLQASAVIIQAS